MSSGAHDTQLAEVVDTAGGSAAKSKRKKTFCFLPSSDVLLLKEALKHTPWAAEHGDTQAAWYRVAIGLRGALPMCTADGKACRRRFSTLLDAFRREELQSLRASGTAEDYEEREQLLTGIISLKKVDKTEKEKRDAELHEAASAEVVRDATAGLRRPRSSDSSSESPSPSAPKRSKQTSTEMIADYLQAKEAARSNRREERQKQLHLEARRLDLEVQRLQQDRERGERFMEMMSAQMSMMAKLSPKENNKTQRLKFFLLMQPLAMEICIYTRRCNLKKL
ncbi:unnamed protein product [Phytophthora fragariaefolia]|uniref:Unnamed protein product n=1 Tax=Phytophthora fragariaefolia TaxID=1490495 RepID=A0A9W7D2J4_9STRA|nr:unnamed protein product [Phytophthora fragariaefolia]